MLPLPCFTPSAACECWTSSTLIRSFAVDASSASEDDLDSEDSEQEVKSCSHCRATSENTSHQSCYLTQWTEFSVSCNALQHVAGRKKISKRKISSNRFEGVAPGGRTGQPAAVHAVPHIREQAWMSAAGSQICSGLVHVQTREGGRGGEQQARHEDPAQQSTCKPEAHPHYREENKK